jgi:hypothetical protein
VSPGSAGLVAGRPPLKTNRTARRKTGRPNEARPFGYSGKYSVLLLSLMAAPHPPVPKRFVMDARKLSIRRFAVPSRFHRASTRMAL